MAYSVLAVTEQRNGSFRKVSYEILSEARRLADELGGDVAAAILGNEIAHLAEPLAAYGADAVFVADDPIFTNYSPEGSSKTITELVKKLEAKVVLFGATAMGKDLAPRVAARLDVGLATDCVALRVENGEIIARRPMYAGKVIAEMKFNTSPVLASLRPNVFAVTEKDGASNIQIEKAEVPVAQNDLKAVVKEIIARSGGKLDVSEATIVVSGGRGMKAPENFKILEELAEVLGAAVGASRAAVDAGWRPHSDQVGQTGKTVSPNLYIACGISGAIQHLAGMSSSKCIVAVNKDPDAPIFQKADYGIVGDLFEVVPKLTEELKKIVEK
ncbi:MAG: electron transfer flavoprotein subunit alpha/FixB family protein [Calditrichaeota bacterium]|nr:electron transfer flavoprotein subunit alpha/FixB family protein [Calditrichota bacterium]